MKQQDPCPPKTAFKVTEGIPHPKWKVVRQWVEKQGGRDNCPEAWSAFVGYWLARLKEVLGREYRRFESKHFQLLSGLSRDEARALLDFSEMARKTILDALSGAACDPPSGKYVVLACACLESYYRYISHYYPPGKYGGSGGIFLGGDCAHFVLTPGDLVRSQRVVAHELTHACLSHLPLPLWLNEGVTTIMEKTIFRETSIVVTHELAECHQKSWTSETVQAFWSGGSFHSPDSWQEMSYDLAEILVRNLLSDHRDRFLDFLCGAHHADAGESAAEEILGVSLSEYAAMFLGEGEWAPRPVDAKSYQARGCYHAGRKKYDRALPDFHEAIRLKPKDPAGYFFRALAHYERGEWDETIADATKAIKLAPKQARAYVLRHLAYAAKGDVKKAQTDQEKALRLASHLTKEGLRFEVDEA
jgi:tetratricopeptide (TPR) repeat protein